MNQFIRTALILAMAVLFSTTATSEDGHLVFLIQAKGKVEYSADGEIWRKVRRNKFLYEGNLVRTGDNGACRLISRETGMIESLGSNTEAEIRAEGTKTLRGVIPKAEHPGTLMGVLRRKFAKVQKYTAIQRSGKNGEQIELETIRDITLSENHPDLVWENVGPEYSYQLTVGERLLDIPGSDDAIVRFTLGPTEPGQSDYGVRVLYNGEILYTPEKKGTLRWLSDAENKSFRERKQRIEQTDHDNGFLLGNFMDEQGLKVAAMDQYRKFMTENPEANEVRPFLIRVLNALRLKKLEEAEAVIYHKKLGNK